MIAWRVIEREVRPHREARATAIQPGTLKILDSVGLLPPFLEAAQHVRSARVYGPDMSELRVTSFEGLDCQCEFECNLPQYETQRILEAHLASLGGKVERGITALAHFPGPGRGRTDGIRRRRRRPRRGTARW